MEKFSNKFKEDVSKETVKNKLRSVIDFPKEGINFQDISGVLMHPDSYRFVVKDIADNIKNDNIDVVVGLDARGFILGPMIADKLNVGFAMVRKPGKMPPPYIEQEYELEYGTNTISISSEYIDKGMNVHLHDDVIVTAGTLNAAIKLVEQIGANVVSISTIIEMSELKGRNKIKGYKLYSFLII